MVSLGGAGGLTLLVQQSGLVWFGFRLEWRSFVGTGEHIDIYMYWMEGGILTYFDLILSM